MEPRSLTLSLLLTLFFPLFLSAAVSSSSVPSPSPALLPSPDSFASRRSPLPAPSPPPPRPPLFTPPKQLQSDRPTLHQSPPWITSPPRPRPFCPSDHRYCHQSQRSVARKSPSKPELNFGEKLGLLFIGVVVVLQVLLGSFLVYKRIQLKKVGRREQRDIASSSGP